MTKNSKRRAWTPTQVRTLKTLASKKTHVIWPRMDDAGYPAILLGSETLKVLTHSAIAALCAIGRARQPSGVHLPRRKMLGDERERRAAREPGR